MLARRPTREALPGPGPSQTATETVTISNAGEPGFDLTWNLSEVEDADWLSETPRAGTIVSGGSQEVQLTFDSTGLGYGAYAAVLLFASNDPDEGELQILVTLHAAVGLEVTLQAVPAPGDNVRFDVTLYDSGVLGPVNRDSPWLVFEAQAEDVRFSFTDLIGTPDATGKKFTVLLPPEVGPDVYDITIVAKRDGGLLDTLVNLRDDVRINPPPEALEIVSMGTLLEGNAMDDPRPGVEPASIINSLDASVLVAALGIDRANGIVTGGQFDPSVDFNRDGTVDGADVEILKANYFEFSPVLATP